MGRVKTIPNNLFFESVEQIIAEGRSVEMTVKGFSMRPFLRNERDEVLLSPLSGRELQEGMVVLFRYKGRHILHRICHIECGEVVCEGDGNYRQREQCRVEDVVAYVSKVRLERGRSLHYGSGQWRRRTLWSLACKRLRNVAIYLKRKILG